MADLADLAGMTNAVKSAANDYDLKVAGNPATDGLVSNDGHTTLILVTLVGTHNDAADYGPEYMAAIEEQTGEGFDVYSVGDVSSNEIYGKIAADFSGRYLRHHQYSEDRDESFFTGQDHRLATVKR